MSSEFEKFHRQWSTAQQQEQRFNFEKHHLAIIRLMCVVWDASEFGAPIIWPLFPEKALENMAKHLGLTLNPDDVDFASEDFQLFKYQVGHLFEIFLHNAELAIGSYSYNNPLASFEEAEWTLDSYREATAPICKTEVIRFAFTDQHRKLLKHSNCGWLDYYQCPGINSKRPYGDRTDFVVDMAKILELASPPDVTDSSDLSEEVINRLNYLHYHEMLPALQLLLQQGTIKLGCYRKIPATMPCWQIVPSDPISV